MHASILDVRIEIPNGEGVVDVSGAWFDMVTGYVVGNQLDHRGGYRSDDSVCYMIMPSGTKVPIELTEDLSAYTIVEED